MLWDMRMRITVLLGGSLRNEAGGGKQQLTVEIPADSCVEELLTLLNLPLARVKIIMVNARGSTLHTLIGEGDRVALFPPELSFNTFVSLGFRKESVEARKTENA